MAAAVLAAEVSASATTSDTSALAYTMPANILQAGATYVIDVFGIYVPAAVPTSPQTLSLWLKIGTTKIATLTLGTPMDGTTQGFYARFMLTVRSNGSSAMAIANGFGSGMDTATSVSSPTTFSTVTSTMFIFGFATSVANSDTIKVENALIEQVA